MVQDLLPLVASLNKKGPQNAISEKALENDSELSDLSTTSNQYAIVESDHPYRPASVANYRVSLVSLFASICYLRPLSSVGWY